MGLIWQRLRVALTLTVLITFLPTGSLGAAAVDCAAWFSPSECSNINNSAGFGKGKSINNIAYKKIGSNGRNYKAGSSVLDHLNSSGLPDNMLEMEMEREGDSWPLKRVVSVIVPVFFGIIGFAGLLGNALVILDNTNNNINISETHVCKGCAFVLNKIIV